MIVYLDLDRTLFKTEQTPLIWAAVAELYPHVSVEELRNSREAFYHHVGDLYYYDFANQLSSYGIESAEAYSRLATHHVADGRLEYEGAAALVKSLQLQGIDVQILTFGLDDYQRFKASLCPGLRGLQVVTTTEPKAMLLDELGVECWLVDDKPIGDELPGNVSFVQVSLEGQARVAMDWPVFNSLDNVRFFFEEVFAD